MKQKYWEWCEKEVILLTGGKATPASGARRIKGDVRLYNEGWYIEVKSTEKTDYINLQYIWFKTLEKIWDLNVCLVVFFGDKTGGVYFFEKKKDSTIELWSSIKAKNNQLPQKIVTQNGIWTLETLDSLAELKD